MRNDIPAVLSAFDILAHFPASESFGLALAEAMAAGLPAIATNVGGCSELVRQNETGLLIPLGDSKSMLAAFDQLLSPNGGKEIRLRMGAAGRTIAIKEFSLPRQVAQLEHLYKQITQRKR